MVDFRFYLNKQGIRGQKGEKGDTGFSPSIVEEVNTLTDYRLKIINEFDEFVTDNLRGSDYFDITDPNGTYLRFDKDSGRAFTGALDQATSEIIGGAKIATNEDVETFSENTIVTPALFADSLSKLIVSPDGSLNITQNQTTSKTEITFNSSTLDSLRVEINKVKEDLTTESQTRLNTDRTLQNAIYSESTTREIKDNELRSQLSTKLEVKNIKQGENIIITERGNDITISSTASGVVIDDNTPSTNKVFSSSKTSDLVGELGNEVNSIAGRLNTLEGEVKVATTENLGLVQPDGTTITIDSDGKISAVGSGSDIEIDNDTIQKNSKGEIFVPFATKVGYSSTNRDGAYITNIKVPAFSQIQPDGSYKYGQVVLESGYGQDVDPLVSFRAIKAGTNMEITKDVQKGEITFNCTSSTPEVDNVTIEVNSEGKLQTTVDINELQAKVEDLQLYKFPNVTIEGDPTINNGQISNFNTTNYLRFPFEFETKGRTWLLNGSFDTGNNVTTQQNIIDSLASVALAVRNGRLVLALSTNGTTFDLGEHLSMSDIEPNTKYYFRLSFSGTQYLLSLSTDKQEYMPEAVVSSTSPIASRPMTISSSGHPYGDTINLNDWDLTVGNVLVWQGMDDVGISSRLDVNMYSITETGKQVIKDIVGINREEFEVNNAYLTGQISTEPKMLQQLKDSRIRTYDKSKFYIRNNATITKDGIAGNFRKGSVRSNGISMAFANKTWELNIKFKTGSEAETTYARIFETSTGNTAAGTIRIYSKDQKIMFVENKNNSDEFLMESGIVNLNTDYWVRLTYNNGYNFYLSSDGEQYNLVGTNTTASALGDQIASFIFGNWYENNPLRPFYGTIDLKEFNFKIDNNVIFDGSYCVDILKNDYTTNGNITINENGIASDFSTSNFVKLDPSIFENIGSKNYTYVITFTMGSVTTGEQTIYCEGRDSSWLSKGFQLETSPGNGHLICALRGTDGTHIARSLDLSNSVLEPYSTHTLRLEYNNGEYKFYLDNVLRSTVTSSSIKGYQGLNPTLGIYNFNNTTEYYFPFGGAIDLNEFKIYVDGKLFYQPTLRIPYTPTNNNSKIVDAKYRSRVQDAYDQYGFANYFTLSDDDFTLPIGDLYGLIDSKIDSTSAGKVSMPSDKYVDLELGTTGSNYTAPADGWLYVVKVANGSGQYVSIEVDSEYAVESSSISSGNWVRVLCPIRKGKNAWVGFNATGETKFFRFIYAEGSV